MPGGLCLAGFVFLTKRQMLCIKGMKNRYGGVVEKPRFLWTVQKRSYARRAKTEPRGVYRHLLNGAV